jgi:dienelactone hydrolase
VYPGAGHSIAAPPYAPTTVSLSPGPGVTFRNGETAEADAKARAGAWTETLRFLADHLGAREAAGG